MSARREPYYEAEGVRLYCGDARRMREVPAESVALIVTSPPYWDIKDYKSSQQLGLGQSYEEYLVEMGRVAREFRRVLQPGRFLAWVIGTRVSDGDLKHIPADSIGLFAGAGFTLKKEIIWVKPKGTQGLWQRGTTQFLKRKPFPCCANINIQHESILIFQREGGFDPPRTEPLPEDFIKETAWSVWQLPVSRTKGHPAPFPVEIPRRLIRLYTYQGERVLDPFVGTGTTLVAARALGREAVGYDLSPEYCALAQRKLEGDLASAEM